MEAVAEPFAPPTVQIGDPIFWHSDVYDQKSPCIGWVCQKPGAVTNTLLVFVPTVGFMEKPSVRHKDDPGLLENANWRQWGCWEIAPWFAQMQKLSQSRVSMIADAEREARKNGK